MKGGRILVVDDDIMVRDTIGRVLGEEGYTVDYGGNGEEAIERVTENPPDAILLDLMMPGMNGRQFLSALREEMGCEDIPVVVMTAVHGIDTHRAFALGASDVVEKPFDVDELLNKVALVLFRAREHETLPERPRLLGRTGPSGVDLDLDEPPSEGVVLIIDNDRASLRRLDALLSDRGYTVVSMARFTDEVPRLARVLHPQAILLDLDLEGTEGLAALRRLRSDTSIDQVPILLFGANREVVEEARPDLSALAAEGYAEPLADEEILRLVTAPPLTAIRAI